jgi:hypothetical protein
MRKWTLIAIQETNKPDRLAESTEHTIESLETRDEKDLLEEPNEVTAVDASSSEVSHAHIILNCGNGKWSSRFSHSMGLSPVVFVALTLDGDGENCRM